MRGSRQGESHGGVYLVDFDNQRVVRTVDWNKMNIDWQGRGWDRGLRGIAFDGETIYIAASDELFAFTPDFRQIGSWRSPYLKHAHEIFRHERTLFVTSTGFDSVLGFDLDRREFNWGLHVSATAEGGFTPRMFDPAFNDGPPPSNELHLNNVHCERGGMHIAGLRTQGVLLFNGRELQRWVSIPEGAHNARPFQGGVLFNDTRADVVRCVRREGEKVFPVPKFAPETLTHVDADDSRTARAGFGRGLCVIDDSHIACGSSPSTIVVHDLAGRDPSRTATLTHDVRNAIHGLEVWPFGWKSL